FTPARGLDLSLSSAFQKRRTRWIPDGNNANGFLLNVSRGFNSNFKRTSTYGGPDCSDASMTCIVNGDLLTSDNYTSNDHFTTGFTAAWIPGERLSNRVTLGYDYNAARNESINPFNFVRTPRGQILSGDYDRTLLSLDYVGSFRNGFGESLSSTFSWGGQLFDDRRRTLSIEAFDFAGPGLPTIESAARRSVLADSRQRVINAGIFLQEAEAWRDRLFLTAGLRVDGNSAFGQDFGLQRYPKLSAAYVLSDHDFWPTDWWETFKVRTAVGESGKAPGAFDAVQTWRPIAGDEGQPAVTPSQRGNPNLGPERTREFEAGFESSVLNGRLGLDVTYFNTVTSAALVPVTYPPSQGILAEQLENVGTIHNRGVEVSVNAGLVRTSAVEWSARLNYSGIDSEAGDLNGQEVSLGSRNFVIEGLPVPSFVGLKIRNPDKFEEPSVAKDTLIGSSFPNRILGIGSNVILLNRLTLDVLGEFQSGGYLANWIGYQNATRGVWQPCQETQAKLRRAAAGDAGALNDVTALQRAKCAIDRIKQDADYWTQPSDFFKLRTVSLTYDLPERLVPGARSASFTLSGRNLFTSTDYDGLDPESSDRSDSAFGRREYYQLPSLRTVQASLRVSF
ncbi:MAG: TonB-dependent receptor, partial [Gemmatimonadota bacterium]|nr:TonB-dependent receptor [Gemmatimonadota bacterium]